MRQVGHQTKVSVMRRLLHPSHPGACRLWLALIVVLHHFSRFEFGIAPVLVFFALSGFWIHRVWKARYSKTRLPWLTFVVSRWWRLAPVMLVACFLTFVVMFATGSDKLPVALSQPIRQVLSSVFFVGYAGMPVRPVGPAWSLDIEMQFYLVAPMLVIIVQRISWILTLLFGYMAFAFSLAFIPGVVFSSFLIFFVIGMAAAEHDWRPSDRAAITGMRLAIILTIAALLSPWRQDLLGANGNDWQAFNIVLAALLLPIALNSGERIGDRTDAALGDHSYVIYLIHWPAILIFRNYDWGGAWGNVVAATGLFMITAMVSYAAWRWIDAPINRKRAMWVASRRISDLAVVAVPSPEVRTSLPEGDGQRNSKDGYEVASTRSFTEPAPQALSKQMHRHLPDWLAGSATTLRSVF